MSQEICVKEQIKDYIIDNIKRAYGKPNKNRGSQPTMSQLLKWNDGENLKHDFTKDHLGRNPIERYGTKIKKSSSPWMSQQQQSFQPFLRVDKTTVVFPVDVNTLNQICKDEQESRTAVNMVPHMPRQQMCFLDPTKHGVNTTDYSLRRVKSQDELHRILQMNSNVKRCSGDRPRFENILYLDSQGNVPLKYQSTSYKENEKQHDQSTTKNISNTNLHQNNKKNKSDKSIIKNYKRQSKPKKLSQEKIVYIDPNVSSPILQERLKKIKKFKDTSRWISDTAFMTYYGKPPFNNYGRANTKPTSGGVIYGEYLFTHNVSPHRGANQPKHLQSYVPALNAAEGFGTIYPQPPRLRNQQNITDEQVKARMKLNPIYASQNTFDGSLKIQKPDLINSYVFSENPNPEIFLKKASTHRIPKKVARKITLQQILKNKNVEKPQQQAFEKHVGKKIKFSEDNAEKDNTLDKTILKRAISAQQIHKHEHKKLQQPQLTFLPDRQNGFLKQVLEKKEKDNRLALKVTQVICTKDGHKKINQQKHENDQNHKKCHIDNLYQDPRNYKNVPAQWLTKIPAAGKPLVKNYSASQLF